MTYSVQVTNPIDVKVFSKEGILIHTEKLKEGMNFGVPEDVINTPYFKLNVMAKNATVLNDTSDRTLSKVFDEMDKANKEKNTELAHSLDKIDTNNIEAPYLSNSKSAEEGLYDMVALKDKAKSLGIKGYGTMKADTLIKKIAEVEKE